MKILLKYFILIYEVLHLAGALNLCPNADEKDVVCLPEDYNPAMYPYQALNVSSKICCFFENLAFNCFAIIAHQPADKFSNEEQISGLIKGMEIYAAFDLEEVYEVNDFQETIDVSVRIRSTDGEGQSSSPSLRPAS